MRSSIPPCPGSRVPESLTLADRFSADSARSPTCPATLMIAASPSQYHISSGYDRTADGNVRSSHDRTAEFDGSCITVDRLTSTAAITTLPATDAMAPSQVLPGLSDGAILWWPHARPA